MHDRRLLQQGQRSNTARVASAAAPRRPPPASHDGMAPRVGHDENGAPALHDEPLGEFEHGAELPVGIGLTGDDEVGGARVRDDAPGQVRTRGLGGDPLRHERLVDRHALERGLELGRHGALGAERRVHQLGRIGQSEGEASGIPGATWIPIRCALLRRAMSMAGSSTRFGPALIRKVHEDRLVGHAIGPADCALASRA